MDTLKRLAANRHLNSLKIKKGPERPVSDSKTLEKDKTVGTKSIKSLNSSEMTSSSKSLPVENKTARFMREADVLLEANEREIQTQFANDHEAWMKSKVDAGFFPPKKS